MLKVLFVGDIVGRPGRTWLKECLGALREELEIDLVIANAENAAAGAGITTSLVQEIQAAGVDGITLGDHVWDQRGFEKEIDRLERVCRPANLDPVCPGRDHLVIETKGQRVAVFTVLGRNFMKPRDCPFRAADRVIQSLDGQVDAILAEIHAEATSEKVAFGRYLEGRVAAVLGTHTHVPTADAAILPKGTAYITDVGMTGPYDSVIGRDVAPVVSGFLDGLPRRFSVAKDDVRLSAVLIEIDSSGLAQDIRLIVKGVMS
ncbi:MAG: TIGR00282 family metallophosphoesterase [Verrucomicrobia bacterium]|nr:MAG: TIGR00282 family metallophosphoesterase [Verrucomicrobiota bacterium]